MELKLIGLRSPIDNLKANILPNVHSVLCIIIIFIIIFQLITTTEENLKGLTIVSKEPSQAYFH